MSTTIDRTTLEVRYSVARRPSTATHIINPDLSAVVSVPRKYRKIIGDDVLERTTAEKAAVNAAEIVEHNLTIESTLKSRIGSHAGLDGIAWSITASGLVISFSLSSLIVNDTSTITPDMSLIKYVEASLVYNSDDDEFYMVVFEKIDGEYADLQTSETLYDILGKWSVVANGTSLVEVV